MKKYNASCFVKIKKGAVNLFLSQQIGVNYVILCKLRRKTG